MRLHKFMAHAGIASRRGAEELIRQGRVKVNGRVVTAMGTTVDPAADRVVCDGRRLLLPKERRYLLLNKPRGAVSTLSDPQGRVTVRSYLPGDAGRVFPVGRLDRDVEGVLLFTDDGALANRLAHPRYGAERTYHARVRGSVTAGALQKLRRGFRLEDGPVRPEKVRVVRRNEKSTTVSITLREGRKHEVKRIFLAVGHPVQSLRRVSFAGLGLGKLRPGQYRYLKAEEASRLLEEEK